ncbi:MAG TPA: dienelactone hydrolase family protein [Chitinivibrionales bacterium]|nr:dienelactone hydrolase family protein [Chitinivibrionales bacterium]
MKPFMFIASMLLMFDNAGAAIVTKEVIYKVDTLTCKGFLAYDKALETRRPGILVCHDWWGLGDFTKGQTKKLAELGYVAFAVDMYGNGAVAADSKAAAKMAGAVRGTPLLRQRIREGLAVLLRQPLVDSSRVAGIGYCFGGSAMLELAYSGAKVNGVVAFHGGLFPPKQEDLGNIKAKFLFLHGAEDPTTPQDAIRTMEDMLSKAGADWQMVMFSNTVHGFTNPASGSDKSKGAAYNPLSAARAWEYMKLFFQELFANGRHDRP